MDDALLDIITTAEHRLAHTVHVLRALIVPLLNVDVGDNLFPRVFSRVLSLPSLYKGQLFFLIGSPPLFDLLLVRSIMLFCVLTLPIGVAPALPSPASPSSGSALPVPSLVVPVFVRHPFADAPGSIPSPSCHNQKEVVPSWLHPCVLPPLPCRKLPTSRASLAPSSPPSLVLVLVVLVQAASSIRVLVWIVLAA